MCNILVYTLLWLPVVLRMKSEFLTCTVGPLLMSTAGYIPASQAFIYFPKHTKVFLSCLWTAFFRLSDCWPAIRNSLCITTKCPHNINFFNPQHDLGGCHCDSPFTDEVMTHPRPLSCAVDQTASNPPSDSWAGALPAALQLPTAVMLILACKLSPNHEIAKAALQISAVLLPQKRWDIRLGSSPVAPVTLRNELMKARGGTIQLRDDSEISEVRSPVCKELWFLLERFIWASFQSGWNEHSAKAPHLPFTQIHLLLTFYSLWKVPVG